MTTTILTLHAVLGILSVVTSVFAVKSRAPAALRRWTGRLFFVLCAQEALGDALYPTYLRVAKPALVLLTTGSRSAADLFDVKEHLAFFALVLGAGAAVAARDSAGPIARTLTTLTHATIVLTATLGLAVSSLKLP